MEKIKFALVGCGNIGMRHLAVLNSESGADIAAVLMGWALLGEQISVLRLFGVILICLGVWIVARSV